MIKTVIIIGFIFIISSVYSQDSLLLEKIIKLEQQLNNFSHRFDVLEKISDDVLWFTRLDKHAQVDKVFIYGTPPHKVKDSTVMGAFNPIRFWAYVFIPKNLDINLNYPLLILPHGGVHSNLSTYYTHIVRELVAQGYVVIAPEYRGSTGYGKAFYERIDYGGREIDDAEACRKYMVENYNFVDSNRVGLIGWSHGGLISIMCAYNYPQNYKVIFAGVPVSDLLYRIDLHGESYQNYFSADYHIGQTIEEDPEEYKRRSPAYQAHKLQTPLLIHTNTNDDDVYASEVQLLIDALKKENKDFTYKIFNELPGGHSFDRMDHKQAKEIRLSIYNFLAKYLNPPNVFNSVEDINKAAYLPYY